MSRETLWAGGALTSAFGIGPGLALAALVQVLRQSSLPYRVSVFDPLVFILASLSLIVATAGRRYIPARATHRSIRGAATRVDVMPTLTLDA
jgi:hypothetical protein